MSGEPTLIERYMGRLDGDEPATAMELVEPDVTFNLHLPGKRVSGTTREELWGYVSGRPAVVRRHNIVRALGGSRDFESVYGIVTDDGVETGAFLATARLSARGLLAGYLVYFELDIRLFGLDEVASEDG